MYNRACVACHAGQLPTAPKRGDQATWAPRLAQGMDTLVQHVTQGFKAMQPRGLCMAAFCKVVVASTVFSCGYFQYRQLPFRVKRDSPNGLPITRRA